MMTGVDPEPAPQKLERAPAAMASRNAGAPNLKEPRAGAACNELFDVEFARTPEAEMALGNLPPKQAIDPDDLRRSVAVERGPVDDGEMIGDSVEWAEVAAGQTPGGIRDCAAFLEEDAIAQPLRASDVHPCRRQTCFEHARVRKGLTEPGEIALSVEALEKRA
jgi:hypothetical protein